MEGILTHIFSGDLNVLWFSETPAVLKMIPIISHKILYRPDDIQINFMALYFVKNLITDET